MELKIKVKRLTDNVIATVKEFENEEYYCLSEILEQLGLKSSFNEKIIPLKISAKIIWGL